MLDIHDDTKGGYRRIERLTGPGRRRRWSAEEKARIVAETLAPGARVSEVARRWHLSPQQVFGWRRAARMDGPHSRASIPPAPHAPPSLFVPLVTTSPSASSAPTPSAPAAIEIRLAGAVVRADPGTDAGQLTTVLRAVRRSATPS
jgi:transposase